MQTAAVYGQCGMQESDEAPHQRSMRGRVGSSVKRLATDDQQQQRAQKPGCHARTPFWSVGRHRTPPPNRRQISLMTWWFDGYSGTGKAVASAGLPLAN